ncbi:NAD(P)/FAD-dependent oxidoreductase [Streptomyces purpurogeneiscleroticus]|uniref:NAD(P)/FAD-dependent oxidoreductase n=1 Tax=Streptomyces purpurogeneiscleroticus TaxID=68259 RepID=UPI001CBAF83A|nr:NAD(P)/FAD-dependent oxidoreductase [Streptomyces purpurogeneiscleroticus]
MTNAAANSPAYDVVVVGAGAGGLNAALVLARSRRRVAVVDAGQPRNAPAAHMHGFLSRDGMAPREILAAGRVELACYGVDLIRGQVDLIDGATPHFQVRMAGGPVLTARHVIVATGLRDDLPDIPGVRERWGTDLLFCPYCHAYEVRDQPIGVLGTHPGAAGHALLLRQWSDDIVYFPHTQHTTDEDRERLTARGVRIVEGTVERLVVEDDRLRGVELAEGRAVPRSAVFVVPTMVPRDALLTGLGCAKDDNGWVTTDRAGRTSVPGVWAVGNVVDPRAMVVTAAGMGAAAAFALNLELVDDDITRAVDDHRTATSLPPLPPLPPLVH